MAHNITEVCSLIHRGGRIFHASLWDGIGKAYGSAARAARSVSGFVARVNWELLLVIAGLLGFWVFAGWVMLLGWRSLLAWWSL